MERNHQYYSSSYVVYFMPNRMQSFYRMSVDFDRSSSSTPFHLQRVLKTFWSRWIWASTRDQFFPGTCLLTNEIWRCKMSLKNYQTSIWTEKSWSFASSSKRVQWPCHLVAWHDLFRALNSRCSHIPEFSRCNASVTPHLVDHQSRSRSSGIWILDFSTETVPSIDV